MRRFVILSVALAIGACGKDPIKQAEERVTFLERHHATLDEMCAAKRQVQVAALDTKSDKYELARAEANLACNGANLYGPGTPANSDDRARVEQQTDEILRNADSAVEVSRMAVANARAKLGKSVSAEDAK